MRTPLAFSDSSNCVCGGLVGGGGHGKKLRKAKQVKSKKSKGEDQKQETEIKK